MTPIWAGSMEGQRKDTQRGLKTWKHLHCKKTFMDQNHLGNRY